MSRFLESALPLLERLRRLLGERVRRRFMSLLLDRSRRSLEPLRRFDLLRLRRFFSRERSLDLFRRREVERDLLRRRRSRESSEELDEELLADEELELL